MIRNITIPELKKDYSDRAGFIFIGAADCNAKTCEEAAKGIKNRGYTEHLPEFIGQIDNKTFAFVYPEGVSFITPVFLEFCRHWSMVTQAFTVDSLCAWLKNQ